MKDKLIPWKKHGSLPEHRRDEDPFDVLHREINELFDGYYSGFGGLGRRTAGSAGYELSETDDEIRVKIELPGMDEKDIAVELEEDMLVIHGERKEEEETGNRNYHISQMSHRSCRRTIPLPVRIDRDKAMARFKRGVLTLTLPKTDQVKCERKRIPVVTD